MRLMRERFEGIIIIIINNKPIIIMKAPHAGADASVETPKIHDMKLDLR